MPALALPVFLLVGREQAQEGWSGTHKLCYKRGFTGLNGFAEEPGGRVTVHIINIETIMS
jgi:hypothetical protein